jgi:hypothetical protein
MLTRTLTIKFQNGFETTIILPYSDGGELSSAQEFVNELIRYQSAFQKFRARAPILSMGVKTKHYADLGSVFNAIVNARKFIDIPAIHLPLKFDQHFSIDMITGTFTLYKVDNKDEHPEERGTMPLDMVYSNWIELFYPDCYELETADVKTTEEKLVKPIYCNCYTEQMKEQLDSYQFNLWEYFFEQPNELFSIEHVKDVNIEYSGAGDSGCTDNVYLNMDAPADFNFDHIQIDSVDRLIWDLIESQASGFYNNDGGRGSITLSPKSFQWDHFDYVQEENQSVAIGVKLDEDDEDDDHVFTEPEDEDKDEDEDDDDYKWKEVEEASSDEKDDEECEEHDEDEEDFDEIGADDRRHYPKV